MHIGGWQKTSLLDFPKKISTVIFTIGCPYRCRFCYNPELVVHPLAKPIKDKEIFDHLQKRKGLIEAVVITGGEPLQQKDLLDFIKKIKKLGYLIKLDTNGFYYHKLKEIINAKVLDYIAMDIKAPLEKYDEITQVKNSSDEIPRSIDLIMNSGIQYEFRSTIIDGFHKKDEIMKMAQLIQGAEKYYLQRFNNTKALIDNSYQKNNAISQKEMKDIAKQCKKYVKKCKVR